MLTLVAVDAVEMEEGFYFLVDLTRGHDTLPLVEQFPGIIILAV